MKHAEFPVDEYQARCERTRKLMADARLDALLITSEPNYRYYSGHYTETWLNKSRPMFMVLPLRRDPMLIVGEPEVGGIRDTSWVSDVRTIPGVIWDAETLPGSAGPAYEDSYVSLIAEALQEAGAGEGTVGAELGTFQRLGMPVADLERVKARLSKVRFVDGTPAIWGARLIKSQREIVYLKKAVDILAAAFEELFGIMHAGMTEQDICRQLSMLVMKHGADRPGYIHAVADLDTNRTVMGSPTERRIKRRDLVYIDGGCVHRGYWADFSRVVAVEGASDAQRRAHSLVVGAVRKVIEAARPGVAVAEMARASRRFLEEAGIKGTTLGRIGHGIGLEMPEPPSIHEEAGLVLQPRMVFCSEPNCVVDGAGTVVSEEQFVIQDGDAWRLSPGEGELRVVG